MFAPSIVIDELWRRLKGRRDVLCCCFTPRREEKSVSKKKKTTTTDDTTTPPQTTLAPNALIRFMDKKYVVFERGVRAWCIYIRVSISLYITNLNYEKSLKYQRLNVTRKLRKLECNAQIQVPPFLANAHGYLHMMILILSVHSHLQAFTERQN